MGSIAIVETGIRSPPASSASSPSTSLELAGKVALVTGGSQGIGQAVAAALVGQGAQVVITYSSNKSAADDTVRRLGVDKVVAIRSHAGKVEDVQTLVDKVVKGFGKIDILIANAGQSPAKVRRKPL
jgi:3-oxoacyl-[acyl-carrier protein] reductase